jgi:hypothetical protein
MKKIFHLTLMISFVAIGFVMQSCKKDPVINPYDQYKPKPDSLAGDSLDPASIQGLHKNIFKPTCANSGCHDGTFEPDYRTIESTYNSLVYQGIIKNYVSAPLQYRVKPGDAANSMLLKRITEDIDGISGVMPLVIDPKSDWPTKKEQYIANLSTWINNGAKDVMGNAPSSLNLLPQMSGFYVASMGSTTSFGRNTNGVCLIPTSSDNIDLYFSFLDDYTSASSLTVNEISFSLSANHFEASTPFSLTIVTPFSDNGFSGMPVNYTHKYSFSNLRSTYPTGSQVFVRVKIKDDANPAVSIPSGESLPVIIQYFSFIVG